MIAATAATAATASGVVNLMIRSVTGSVPYAAGFPIGRLESRYELGELGVGDAAKLADLDAAELLGAEKVVHLVPANVEQFGYLLDGVCLQLALHSWSRCVVVSAFVSGRVYVRLRADAHARGEMRQTVRRVQVVTKAFPPGMAGSVTGRLLGRLGSPASTADLDGASGPGVIGQAPVQRRAAHGGDPE